MTLASRIAVMRDGQLQQCADPRTVYCHEWNPSNAWMAHGGSAILYASILELAGKGTVIGIERPEGGGAGTLFLYAAPGQPIVRALELPGDPRSVITRLDRCADELAVDRARIRDLTLLHTVAWALGSDPFVRARHLATASILCDA